MNFHHEMIDPNPPCGKLAFCLTAGLTGNDRPNNRIGHSGICLFKLSEDLRGMLTPNLVTDIFEKYRDLDFADIDYGGDREVVLSESDSLHLGSYHGRVWWVDPADWEATVLERVLLPPDSSQVGNFSGNRWSDLYVAEIGFGKHETPRHFLFLDHSHSDFEGQTIHTGVATREAQAVDLTEDGRLNIVGKSCGRDQHIDTWYNHGGFA